MSNGVLKTDLNLIPAGYKQTEVGVIPEDWKVKSIGEIASIFSGGTPNRKIPEYWDGDIPWVTTTLIDGAEIDSAREFITQRGLENSSTNWCKAGTILLAMYGQGKTRGKAAILSIDATINQACAAIELKDIGSSHYILHILNSMYEKIRELSNSGSQENLSAGIIKSIQIPFPPKKEQTAIANALSDVDALISEQEKLIAKKQAIKTATMQQLLTGRTRLPQFALREDGTPKGTKPSELGEIPEDWEVHSLSSICDVRDGTHDSPKYKDNGIPLVTSKNIVDDILDLSNVSLISPEDAFEIDKRSKVDKGDIIMSMIGTVGSAVLLLEEPKFCIKNVALFKPKKVSGEFLVQLIRSKIFQDYLEDSMDGGIQKFVSLGTLRNMEISLPPKEEQTAIATILSDMDDEIQALEQRLGKTRQIKQGMMQELLTGKTRLPYDKE
ncbi:TPA: restriction endonuclease subunit S [Providencia alcalifaciens]|uniref:restriction endonuclease subunit S n=1 Tax=Providencia sp. PROV039 TaxID=2949770 RepID=UPI00234B0900|nr:restriction endonuclease subunit S [Providencia sp. PROV039]